MSIYTWMTQTMFLGIESKNILNKLNFQIAPFARNAQLRAYQWIHYLPYYKTNPDAHFSKLYQVQTNDKLYGLNRLPKRPWESFKNPEETMKQIAYKHKN